MIQAIPAANHHVRAEFFSDCTRALLLTAALTTSAVLAFLGTTRVEIVKEEGIEKERITLRDSGEALSFINELIDLMRAVLPQ